ncbi:60S ribosomal protein L37, putative, partial [Eimeria tenella]
MLTRPGALDGLQQQQQQQQQQELLLPGLLAAAAAAAGPLEVSQRLAYRIWEEVFALPLQQQVQALQSLGPGLLYVLAGHLGAPFEASWLQLGAPSARGPPSYIERCKLAAGLFKLVEAE